MDKVIDQLIEDIRCSLKALSYDISETTPSQWEDTINVVTWHLKDAEDRLEDIREEFSK
jgi:hypothetical protein